MRLWLDELNFMYYFSIPHFSLFKIFATVTQTKSLEVLEAAENLF